MKAAIALLATVIAIGFGITIGAAVVLLVRDAREQVQTIDCPKPIVEKLT